MASELATGWYPDPNDPKTEIYWDGTRWHGRREALKDELPGTGSNPIPQVDVAGVRNLPTRRFWVITIAAIALALGVIFWVIPQVKKSNEEMEWWDQQLHSECMQQKLSSGMDNFAADKACKSEGK